MSKTGAKTQRLEELARHYRVPKSYAISSSVLREHTSKQGKWDGDYLKKEAAAIHQSLQARTYAVRSSALIEDSATDSYAGQFKTILDISPDALGQAIQEVTDHAQDFLHGHLEKFSILVQEFIEPDYAGVLFTRSPSGERQVLIEYVHGRGEDLVSGKIRPKQIELYWSDEAREVFPACKELIGRAKEIEKYYRHPQDIEWCVQKGVLYLLQTRPITTISPQEYQGILHLESLLPKGNFYYEKTEISEIAPRPSAATMGLLEKIYAANGPVACVYEKKGIHYINRPFLKLVADELYIDREAELHTLMPAYSYFPALKPHIARLSGLFTSIKNAFAQRGLRGDRVALQKRLEELLMDDTSFSEYEEWEESFLKDYETIFEINLLAGAALQRFTQLVERERLDIPGLMSGSQKFPHKFSTEGFKGNSLDFRDESEFFRAEPQAAQMASWKQLSAFKQKAYSPALEEAQTFMQLREWGRWLTVKRISQARKLLKKEAKAKAEWTFPKRISSALVVISSEIKGVSGGMAEGILLTKEEIGTRKGVILYTKMLTPDLTAYFDRIEGIVSQEGGLLSHLAIVAREKGVPVLICPKLPAGMKPGVRVKVDATAGTTDVIS